MRVIDHMVLVAVITAVGATGVWGQDGRKRQKKEKPENASALGGLQEIASELKKFGPWNKQAEFIEPAMENLWKTNGWDTESDRFAFSVATQVAKIPPWKVTDRLERFTGLVGERYSLTPRQAFALKGSILRETAGLVMRHAPLIMKQIHKALASDQRFHTGHLSQQAIAELMADWTRATEPIHQDALKSVERINAGFERMLTPEQKRVYQQDLPTLEKIMGFVEERRSAWVRGEWRPEDFGLNSEMLERTANAPHRAHPDSPPDAKAKGRGAGGEVVKFPTRWVSHDPNTWIAYARSVIKRYQLDAAQGRAVLSIHDELKERGEAYLDSHGNELKDVDRAKRATDPRFKPVRDLFDQFVTRLGAIPTEAQKDAAEPSAISHQPSARENRRVPPTDG